MKIVKVAFFLSSYGMRRGSKNQEDFILLETFQLVGSFKKQFLCKYFQKQICAFFFQKRK